MSLFAGKFRQFFADAVYCIMVDLYAGKVRVRKIAIIISGFFLKFQHHPLVEAVFSGLRPAVVGLLAAAALVLMTSENFGNYHTDLYQFVVSILIFLVAFIGTRKFKVSPILMIVLCGAAGWLLY